MISIVQLETFASEAELCWDVDIGMFRSGLRLLESCVREILISLSLASPMGNLVML